ncbi:hypothetical protein TanjilG_32755 [Lupinus angustifolius]|uniref:F-box domain-containing protein n=1 Tax=Lupinus angustifolius TaxID=3871 RepID=A0A4P1RFX1_LUPAN|nr:hypothetical protein TanjilG_32755 [Lupinus angustifolius]
MSTRKRQRSIIKPSCQNVAPPSVLSPLLVEELTVNIMSRLPVKSINRFTSVAKQWNTFLSSSYFIRYHIQRSATSSCLNNHRLLGGGSYGSSFRLSDPLLSIIDNPSPYPTLFGRLLSDIWHDPLIVGSCNGLICWIDYRESGNYICYLNPATGTKSRSPYLRYPSSFNSYNLFGFGYDHINDSYKTVAINCDPNGDTVDEKTLVKVYELGAPTTWKKIQSFPYVPKQSGFLDEPCGVFVKGTLNWLCTRSNDSLVVVSVDLVNDTCKEVSLPRFVDTNRYRVVARPNLSVLGGCLCFSYENRQTHFVLWQMKVYGDASSWNVLFNIPYKDIRIDRNIPNYPKPLLMLNNGDVMMQTSELGDFLLYNPMHNSFKYFEFASGTTLFESIVHIDSLVSPCPTRPHRIRGLPCLYTIT